jgi:hypothetical protein
VKNKGFLILFAGTFTLFISCIKRENEASTAVFTKIDSLTEVYLSLQDSMLHTWNVMIKDENEKLKNLEFLLQELKNTGEDPELIQSLQQRLEQLGRIRFTQTTMVNPHVVEEYDFASNSLISEIISIAENNPTFTLNVHLQELTDRVKEADQRVPIYREEYDAVVDSFNHFVDKIKPYLPEIDENNHGEKKVLFTSEQD